MFLGDPAGCDVKRLFSEKMSLITKLQHDFTIPHLLEKKSSALLDCENYIENVANNKTST